jgi:hypothetical protein
LGIVGDDAQEVSLSNDVRIILVAADFSRELTTTVLWLNERDIDIRCIRMRPYRWQERTFVDVQQILPLPEASDYQVKVREKAIEKRAAEKKFNPDFSKYNVTVGDKIYPDLWKRALGFRILYTALVNEIRPRRIGATPRKVSVILVDHGRRYAQCCGVCGTRFTNLDQVWEISAEPILLQ